MIVRGDAIEPELARLVARLLADAIRRDPTVRTDELLRFVAELEIVAAPRPTFGQAVDGVEGSWLSIPEAAKVSPRSERSLRRDAKAGRIEARQEKVRGPWQVRI